MEDRPPPDGFEKGLRFGCGFVFGGMVLVLALARDFFSTGSPFWMAAGIGAILCGLLAIRYGDRFYRAMVEFWQRWG